MVTQTDVTKPAGLPRAPTPPDSVHGVSIDLGSSSERVALARPPRQRPGAAPRPLPPPVLLDPPLPSAKDLAQLEHQQQLLSDQRRRRRAVGIGSVLLGAVAIAVLVQRHGREDSLAVPALQEVSFTVDSKPEGAAVVLDGKPTGLTTPARMAHWDFAQPHELAIELAGFHPERRPVPAGLHPPDIDLPLSPAAWISATTSQAGATLRLDGAIVGRTPVSFEAPAGRDVTLSVELEGFVPTSRSVRLEPGQKLPLELTLVALARLTARSEPAGATVELDGRAVGLAPIELSVAPGNHQIEFDVPGLAAVKRRVAVGAGRRAEVVARFEEPRVRKERAALADVERRLTADRTTLRRLQAPGGNPGTFATLNRLRSADRLAEEIDGLLAREQSLQDSLANDELELEDRIKAFNLAGSAPPSEPPESGTTH